MGLPELIVVQADAEIVNDPVALPELMAKAIHLRDRAAVGEMECRVDVVTVVYEALVDWRVSGVPERDRLKKIVIEHAQHHLETALEEALLSSGAASRGLRALAIWGDRPWRTMLDYVESQQADLIVRPAAEARAGKRFAKSPDEWQLVRHAPVPVLLTGVRPWHEPTAVVVALDVFSKLHDPLNARLLEQAQAMAQMLAAHVYVVGTFPRLRPVIAELGLFTEYSEQEHTLIDEGTRRVADALNTAGITDAVVDVRAGEPEQVIREVVDRLGPSVVVLGTHARSGVPAAFLGNTSEKLIHELHSDMLVVQAG